jgi:DNA-binding transcriptional MerR regulator
MDTSALMQIGEVAERTGLSLRTIRYYEEVGLVVPATRSQGGFRLYTDTDVERLQVVKRMKPLEFTLEQMRELLDISDRLASPRRLRKAERDQLFALLTQYRDAIGARCETLREQLATTQAFDATLASYADSLTPEPAATTGRG